MSRTIRFVSGFVLTAVVGLGLVEPAVPHADSVVASGTTWVVAPGDTASDGIAGPTTSSQAVQDDTTW